MRNKILLFIAFSLICLIGYGQQTVEFKVYPDGSFRTEDGKDFVVVEFEGKSAHEIFQELSVNVNSMYNNPSKVMSTVEDASIKIRAISDLVKTRRLGIPIYWSGYYQLEFQIKDGRVRVSAPFVETYLNDGAPKYNERKFKKLVGSFFTDGEVKENKMDEYATLNLKFFYLINTILGTLQKEINDESEEDW